MDPREFELASVHLEYSFEAVQSIMEVPPISIFLVPFTLVVRPMLWLGKQCASRGAQGLDCRALMPWNRGTYSNRPKTGIVNCHVQVPFGLPNHRILQFFYEQEHEHKTQKKVVICKIPHGIPPGAYVPVAFATADFCHADVKTVRASGEMRRFRSVVVRACRG